MSEKKKFMPAITNYLSDSDEEIDDTIDNNPINPPAKTNYTEWKRSQKTSNNLQNGSKSIQVPLGDISSCEEDSKFDDTEPLFKIMNCLADKDAFRKRNDSLRKRHKKPSHFLLFSRMKQQKHFDLSYNDLCQVTQASWDNMQSIENEELIGNIDQRIVEYKELLLKLRATFLPDSTGRLKPNSWVSAAVAGKQEPSALSIASSPLNSIANSKQNHTHIPERLQNLAGNASVYNAPDKSKRSTNPPSKTHPYKTRTLYTSDTSLNYVAAIDCNQNCVFHDCENKPIDDYRWHGQYCSATCLMQDCNNAFQNWLTEQLQPLPNGDASESVDNDDEIMMYLATPTKESPLPDTDSGSISREDNIFQSLLKPNNAINTKPSIKKFTFDTDIDADPDMVAASRLHSLISRSSELQSSNQSDSFDYFQDRAQQQSVTETSL